MSNEVQRLSRNHSVGALVEGFSYSCNVNNIKITVECNVIDLDLVPTTEVVVDSTISMQKKFTAEHENLLICTILKL